MDTKISQLPYFDFNTFDGTERFPISHQSASFGANLFDFSNLITHGILKGVASGALIDNGNFTYTSASILDLENSLAVFDPSAPFIVQLPLAQNTNSPFGVVFANVGNQTVTLQPSGSDLLQGVTASLLIAPKQAGLIFCFNDPTNAWWMTGANDAAAQLSASLSRQYIPVEGVLIGDVYQQSVLTSSDSIHGNIANIVAVDVEPVSHVLQSVPSITNGLSPGQRLMVVNVSDIKSLTLQSNSVLPGSNVLLQSGSNVILAPAGGNMSFVWMNSSWIQDGAISPS